MSKASQLRTLLMYSFCHLLVCGWIMQTEVRTKANTIDKNRGVVKAALGLVASLNPEGLSPTDWKVDMTQKLQERIDLQQQRDKLQQASFVLCIPAINAAILLPQHGYVLNMFTATDESLMAQAYMCVALIDVT